MALKPRDVPTPAHGDPAFRAGDFLTYPPVSWWRGVLGLVPPPTRAKYWTAFSLDRLTRATPLPGRTRNKAANTKRAKLAQRWKRQLASAEAAGADRTLQWRIGFVGTLEYQQGSGPSAAAKIHQSSPWQPTAGAVPDDTIQSIYWDVCRAAIRGSTGFTSDRDNRHGPSWTDEQAPTVSNFLKDFAPGQLTYDNTNLFPSRVTLYLRQRPRPKGVRDRTCTLYREGSGESRARGAGGELDLGDSDLDDFGNF